MKKNDIKQRLDALVALLERDPDELAAELSTECFPCSRHDTYAYKCGYVKSELNYILENWKND